jgi:hypothetical protein
MKQMSRDLDAARKAWVRLQKLKARHHRAPAQGAVWDNERVRRAIDLFGEGGELGVEIWHVDAGSDYARAMIFPAGSVIEYKTARDNYAINLGAGWYFVPCPPSAIYRQIADRNGGL